MHHAIRTNSVPRHKSLTQRAIEKYGMAEVDRISEMLGKLMAEADESRRQRDKFFEKLDRLERENSELSMLLKRHMDDFNNHLQSESKRFETVVMPSINDYKSVKQKAMGMVSILVVLSAALWEAIKLGLKKIGWL